MQPVRDQSYPWRVREGAGRNLNERPAGKDGTRLGGQRLPCPPRNPLLPFLR